LFIAGPKDAEKGCAGISHCECDCECDCECECLALHSFLQHLQKSITLPPTKNQKNQKNKQKRVPRGAARAKGRAEMARGSVRGGGRRKLVASASEINNNKC